MPTVRRILYRNHSLKETGGNCAVECLQEKREGDPEMPMNYRKRASFRLVEPYIKDRKKIRPTHPPLGGKEAYAFAPALLPRRRA